MKNLALIILGLLCLTVSIKATASFDQGPRGYRFADLSGGKGLYVGCYGNYGPSESKKIRIQLDGKTGRIYLDEVTIGALDYRYSTAPWNYERRGYINRVYYDGVGFALTLIQNENAGYSGTLQIIQQFSITGDNNSKPTNVKVSCL